MGIFFDDMLTTILNNGENISTTSNLDNMVIEHPILVDILKLSKKVTSECYLICLCV